MTKITVQNIKNFMQGTARQIGNEIGMTPEHIVEQVAYRESKCPECKEAGHCVAGTCGCGVPGRWFSTQSCNYARFPDLMGKEEWEEYKRLHGIIVPWNG